MTRVGNVDQVLLLLRARLERGGKRPKPGGASGAGAADSTAISPLDRARALAALDSLGQEEVRKAVVRCLLAEEFGDAIGGDAKLQAMVEDIVRTITEMPGGNSLMVRAVAQLRERDA